MRPSDRDLVDVILGDAPDTVQDKVKEAMANPEVGARYAKWSGLIRSSRKSRAAETLHRDIVDGTLARLKESRETGAQGMGSPAHTAPRPANRPRRRYPLGAIATVGLILLSVSVYVLIGGKSPWFGNGTSSETAQVMNDVEQQKAISVHVDFAARYAGDGTAATPFNSLQMALQLALTQLPADAVLKVTAGSTSETLRFDKRIRIEAVNGKVRIGAS